MKTKQEKIKIAALYFGQMYFGLKPILLPAMISSVLKHGTNETKPFLGFSPNNIVFTGHY